MADQELVCDIHQLERLLLGCWIECWIVTDWRSICPSCDHDGREHKHQDCQENYSGLSGQSHLREKTKLEMIKRNALLVVEHHPEEPAKNQTLLGN